MTAGCIGGIQLSRQSVMQMIHADALDRQEQRIQRAEAEARREQAEGQLQAYYQQFGEYPNETLHRQQMLEMEREERAEARRAQEREAAAEDRRMQLLLPGHKPRTVQEVLAAAAGIA